MTISDPIDDTATAQRAALEALDAAVLDIRRAGRRPGYRARLYRAVGRPIDASSTRVLRVVERASVEVSVGDVAMHLQVDPSTASRLVDLQVTAGYLERTRSAADRRRSALTLTAEGRQVLAEVTSARRELLAEVTHDWTIEELRHLAGALDRLGSDFAVLEDRGLPEEA